MCRVPSRTEKWQKYMVQWLRCIESRIHSTDGLLTTDWVLKFIHTHASVVCITTMNIVLYCVLYRAAKAIRRLHFDAHVIFQCIHFISQSIHTQYLLKCCTLCMYWVVNSFVHIESKSTHAALRMECFIFLLLFRWLLRYIQHTHYDTLFDCCCCFSFAIQFVIGFFVCPYDFNWFSTCYSMTQCVWEREE